MSQTMTPPENDKDVSLQVLQPVRKENVVALIGNPNAGKTTLFNRLTGLRAKTGNFPGITIEKTEGSMDLLDGHRVNIVDLPGLYSIAGATDEERISRDVILGQAPGMAKPAAVIVVLDATNLERNLFLISQVIELKVPTIAVLNMIDLARRDGLNIDADKLTAELGCPVVPVSARSGEGIEQLKQVLHLAMHQKETDQAIPHLLHDTCAGCSCPYKGRYDWAEKVTETCLESSRVAVGRKTDRIDRILTHPVAGIAGFFAIMVGVFYLIFSLASVPMDLVDAGFAWAQGFVGNYIPEGHIHSLIVDGVIGGIGGVIIFLPQICILFFCLSLLEDTGYLSRAVFVMDRLMRHVGLPGKAFIPMLSAHACAIPGIMATRGIEDKRDRLVTILTLPLLTCSARLPVYAMVVALLFGDQPGKASLLFTGAYSLGIVAVLCCAFVFKKTILPGQSKPLVMELPSYKIPSLRTALLITYDRAMVFVKKAGTIILLISLILWVLATFPTTDPSAEVVQMRQQIQQLENAGQTEEADALAYKADILEGEQALEYSFAGRAGKLIEPVVKPLGFDWRIGVGVVSSFAAREVIVSTLAVVYGVGEDVAEENPDAFIDRLRTAKRSDGQLLFSTATCYSLLVFYVLAMQCLPTQAVTKRETGSWKWAAFQLGYMTVLAYSASLITYQVVSMITA
ncbi:MAG: ferrous iron transporter B [Phycisphaeraceae bacterium]|nr:ferrous iron transporter B [Phycisphaeraceae bacterium]